MIWLALLMAQAAPDAAVVSRGARVFAESCAVGYCHGNAGAANRAPRLAGRSFDRDYLLRVTRDGLPNSGMPGWKERLGDTQIQAVVAYVMTLAANTVAAVPSAASGELPVPKAAVFTGPAEARRGKGLFFDATREVRCATCHHLEGWGVPVGPNLAAAPGASIAALRNPATASVQTARTGSGETFPALLVDRPGGGLRVYDLHSPPPVLRSFGAGEATLGAGSWKHAAVTAGYTDAELASVLAYLRWLGSR